MQIVPYLVGGLTAFLVADIVPIPSPSQQFGAVAGGHLGAGAVAGHARIQHQSRRQG